MQTVILKSISSDISGVIEGGTFIGTGARTMAQTFSQSPQAVISVNAGNVAAGTKLILADKTGKELLTCTPVHDYCMVILSSPEFISGETYTLTVGSKTMECTAK